MRIPPDGPEWLLRFAAAMAPAARLFGVELPISAGELEYVLWQPRIDDTKARRELGFTPLAIEEGMRRTLEHLVATGAIPAGLTEREVGSVPPSPAQPSTTGPQTPRCAPVQAGHAPASIELSRWGGGGHAASDGPFRDGANLFPSRLAHHLR